MLGADLRARSAGSVDHDAPPPIAPRTSMPGRSVDDVPVLDRSVPAWLVRRRTRGRHQPAFVRSAGTDRRAGFVRGSIRRCCGAPVAPPGDPRHVAGDSSRHARRLRDRATASLRVDANATWSRRDPPPSPRRSPPSAGVLLIDEQDHRCRLGGPLSRSTHRERPRPGPARRRWSARRRAVIVVVARVVAGYHARQAVPGRLVPNMAPRLLLRGRRCRTRSRPAPRRWPTGSRTVAAGAFATHIEPGRRSRRVGTSGTVASRVPRLAWTVSQRPRPRPGPHRRAHLRASCDGRTSKRSTTSLASCGTWSAADRTRGSASSPRVRRRSPYLG